MDAGNFRGSRRVAKNKMLKMCIFAKDGDVKNRTSETLFSETMTSFRPYKRDAIISVMLLLKLNDSDQRR